MIHKLLSLFQSVYPDAGIVRYVRTEWNNETRHLSNDDCISFYNNYLTTKGRISK